MEDYTIEQVRKLLHENVMMVTFLKANGETRRMKASTNYMYIPERSDEAIAKQKPAKAPSKVLVSAVDIELGAWRSFRFDSIQTMAVIHNEPVLEMVEERVA